MRGRCEAWLRERRPQVLIFVLVLGSCGYFYPSLGHNEAARLDLTRAIVEDASLRVDRFRYNSADLVLHAGHTYSNKAPGTSLLALAPFSFWRAVLPAAALPHWVYWDAVAHLTTLTTVGLLSALAAAFTFGIVQRATADAAGAALAVIALWFGTNLFPFSTLLFGHAVAAALVAIAFALVYEAQQRRLPLRFGLAGLLLGAAVTTEYPVAVVALPLVVYALGAALRRGRGALAAGLCLGAGLVAGLAPLVAYNLAAFGQVFFSGYQAYVEEGSAAAFRAHALGYAGVHWPGLGEFLRVLGQISVGPQRGLLYLGVEGRGVYACSPVLWLALPGVALMARGPQLRNEAALVAVAVAAMLAVNACYGDSVVYWGGGASIGPRHLIPMLPLLALPLACAARRLPWLFVPLLLVSAFFMLLATAIEPRVPYEYANPFREFLLPSYLRGHLALHRGAFFEPGGGASDAGAVNLGALLGLPGTLQLLPWLAFAGVVGGRLVSCVSPAARAARALLTLVLGAAALPPLVHGLGTPIPGHGLVGAIYQNAGWHGPPAETRQQAPLDFTWLSEPGFPAPFSARWQGAVRIERAGTYLFRLEADDAAFLVLDGRQVAEAHGGLGRPAAVELKAGVHALGVSCYDRDGGARLRLYWRPPGMREDIVPASVLGP